MSPVGLFCVFVSAAGCHCFDCKETLRHIFTIRFSVKIVTQRIANVSDFDV